MSEMLIIGAQLESYRSLKDNTLKLSFETQAPTPDNLVKIAKASQKFGFLAFKLDDFENSEKTLIESIKSDFYEKGKSKSQRLRSVLYINWQHEPKGYEVFDDYYNHQMEKLIIHFKEKLP